MKKLPIIGLLIGAVAALYLKMKGGQADPEPEVQGAAQDPSASPSPSEDTSPPA